MLNINRCKSCLLPKNYPFIVFNVQNICNYCNDYKSMGQAGGPLRPPSSTLLEKTAL